MKCKLCGGPLTEGGAFTEVYRWCKVCEGDDTEPNFRMVTPTEPLWRSIEWDNDWGDAD